MRATPTARSTAELRVADDPERNATPIRLGIEVTLTPAHVDVIAARAVELLAERQGADPWMNRQAAEEYAGMTPGRLDDLERLKRIRRDGKDGSKPMYRRSTIDAYLEGQS